MCDAIKDFVCKPSAMILITVSFSIVFDKGQLDGHVPAAL
jgi:hypothetical protein